MGAAGSAPSGMQSSRKFPPAALELLAVLSVPVAITGRHMLSRRRGRAWESEGCWPLERPAPGGQGPTRLRAATSERRASIHFTACSESVSPAVTASEDNTSQGLSENQQRGCYEIAQPLALHMQATDQYMRASLPTHCPVSFSLPEP